MTAARSAYPIPVEDLLPQARRLAEGIGRVPGRNQLMTELRVGAKKARTIRDRLHAEQAPAESTAGLAEPVAVTGAEPEPGAEQNHPDEQAAEDVSEPRSTVANPAEASRTNGLSVWPVFLLSLPALVAIWSGWVGLGELTGFGIVHPLPGIAGGFALNTAITLPIGMETYAAYALRVWLSGQVPDRARRFAKRSAIGSLTLGALGQVAYHLMKAAGVTAAPWPITALVACLPVAVLGMGAALAHLLRDNRPEVTR